MLNGSFNEGSILYCGMIITMNALGYMLPSWGMCNQFSFVNVMSSCSVKLGTHHAIFVGTTIVVRRDDGRRSSNDPLTPRDGRQQSKQITHLADIRLSANENRKAKLLRPSKKLFK